MTSLAKKRALNARGLIAPLGLCCAFAALALVLALGLGSTGLSFSLDALTKPPILYFRAPRIVMALMAGGALAGAGVTFQAILGNPLADPYIMGVSGGAALGGTLALLLPAGLLVAPAAAFIGAVVATFGSYWLARRLGGSALVLILTGVVFNAYASSVITFIKTVVTATKAQEILFWLMGSLGYPSWGDVAMTAGGVAIGLAILVGLSSRLNALSFGDEVAASLGINVGLYKGLAFFAASLAVGVVVAQVGLVGFIGLVVPHFLRILLKPDHRLLMPASILVGGGSMVLADAIARVGFVFIDHTLPVGVITAFIGGPFFILLLFTHRRRLSA
jgi:iron complex transport system permease protein